MKMTLRACVVLILGVGAAIGAASCAKTSPGPAGTGGQAPSAASQEMPAEYAGMLAKVFPSIVRIEAIRMNPSEGRLTKGWVGGSGVIISADGYILTNCHVAADADFYRIYLYNGERVEATRIGQDAMTDLAVLKLDLSQRAKDAPPLQVAAFGDSDKLVPGNPVFALGSPGFLAQSSTRGIVANPSLVLPEQTAGKMMLKGEDVGMLVRWILHDAMIFGGNSGGPLVNAQGEVIGINEIGVFNLSGAIPGNLSRQVADQIIKNGHVIRGYSGLTVQMRLESTGKGPGVHVADVEPGSPADKAGIKPGDIIVAADGRPIEGEEEKAVAHFYRLETGRLPANEFAVDYVRSGIPSKALMKLEQREPALTDDKELKAWGAVVRDLTREQARDERLPDKAGVWFENIKPGGPAGQAEPDIRRQDVLTAVDGQPIRTIAELNALTEKLVPDGFTGKKSVLVTLRRDGTVINSVVELRLKDERNITPPAVRAWLGASSQPVTAKLGAALGVKSDGGARLTRIFPGTKAEAAGLKVGDVVLALDGIDVNARRQEDADMLNRMIRQYRAGTEAKFTVWREGARVDVPVTLEGQPTPAAQLPYWIDDKLEYEVRELAYDDRVRLQISPAVSGVIVANSVRAGWAQLGGLFSDDLVLEVEGKPVKNIEEFKAAREEAVKSKKNWMVLLVQRRGETKFVEITLKPVQKP